MSRAAELADRVACAPDPLPAAVNGASGMAFAAGLMLA